MGGERLEIPTRFNGPPGSGHGGYVSGRLAELVGEPAEITLRAPTPLGTPLGVEREDGALAASPWTPSDDWLAEEDGSVRPEFVWSVLDCPTYFGFYVGSDPGLA